MTELMPRRLWGVHMSETESASKMPVITEITAIIDETPLVKTFVFDKLFSFRPGQFCMVWVIGVDEIPMAFSAANSITVMKAGDATDAMFSLKVGDKIGIRGPFGNGFSPKGKTIAVAGGIGVTPLFSLAAEGCVDTFILGAKTKSELVFADELKSMTDLKISTDDGTEGYHGFTTGLLDEIGAENYDTICVCGPEMMMYGVLKMLKEKGLEKKAQFSMHRYMKCAVGVCGSCCIDPTGHRVCKDGPVFTGDILAEGELGKPMRGPDGSRKK